MILLAYGFVQIAASHGIGPVWLLLPMGWLEVWGHAQLPGWIGVFLLIRVLFAPESAYRSFRGWGATLLGGSLWLFAMKSESLTLTLATAVPFHFVWAYAVSEWVSYGSMPVRRVLDERPRVIYYAVGLLGIMLLLRLPIVFRSFELIQSDDVEGWWTQALPLVSLIAEAALVCAVWAGAPWARWGLIGLALWGWGTTFWYAGAIFLSVTPQSLLASLRLLAEGTGLALLYMPPGSRWFQTVPDTAVNGIPDTARV